MALLYWLSSRTDLTSVPTGWDKPAHSCAYAVLGFLALRACHGGVAELSPWPTLAAVLLTVSYAGLDELHQSRVPGRDASGMDWLADTGGAALAVAATAGLAALRARLQPTPPLNRSKPNQGR
jgi:VanZ family protein